MQAFPQFPQLWASDARSAQYAPPSPEVDVQLANPAEQVAMQLPNAQRSPAGHTIPQPPQF
jgi:hypothetical protein